LLLLLLLLLHWQPAAASSRRRKRAVNAQNNELRCALRMCPCRGGKIPPRRSSFRKRRRHGRRARQGTPARRAPASRALPPAAHRASVLRTLLLVLRSRRAPAQPDEDAEFQTGPLSVLTQSVKANTQARTPQRDGTPVQPA
jgi:hypothetical protein